VEVRRGRLDGRDRDSPHHEETSVAERSRSVRPIWRSGAVPHLREYSSLGAAPFPSVLSQTHSKDGWNGSVLGDSQIKHYLSLIMSFLVLLLSSTCYHVAW
jgi:hypothetical protein